MNKIFFSADSTCDLAPAQIDRWDIQIAPLYINKGNESFRDRVDIQPQDVFEYFQQTGKLTQTAAVPVGDYLDLFQAAVNAGKTVVHFSISSDFSSSYQNACTAASALPEGSVEVVDTRNLSTGSGLVVLAGCELGQQGLSASEIRKKLEKEVIPRVEASFVIDTLTYLHKGGRCSAVAKLGANLLKLKPCIEVKDGRMGVGKKYRGNWDKCVLQYVRERLTGRKDIDPGRIFITHTPCAPAVVDAVRQEISKLLPFKEIVETSAGCTISNHCGPNTLGILFLRK